MSTYKRNLYPEFSKEDETPNLELQGTPQKPDFGASKKISDEKLVEFKKQLEPKIGLKIESIRHVVDNESIIVVCLTIGTCILYSYLNGTFSKYNTGGKRRNKKRTLRRKYK